MLEFKDRLQRTRSPHTMRSWPLPRAQSPRIESLRVALGSTRPHAHTQPRAQRALDHFTEQLRTEGTPIIEPAENTDWTHFTFVWIGEAPHGVMLQLNRITDPLDVEDTRLERIGESNVHALTLRLPSDWQGSYLFVPLPYGVPPTLHGRPTKQTMVALAEHAQSDPLAREHIPSKAVTASAVRRLPDYAAARGPRVPKLALWRLTPEITEWLPTIQSPVNGESLTLHRWSSPSANEESPVILLLDGEVWRTQFPVATEIAERHRQGRFPAVHLLLLESGGPGQRELDYACSRGESLALLTALRKAARKLNSPPLPDTPWVIAGQSLGGLFAALCATRHGNLVRAAVAQSPSLWWPTPPNPWHSEPGWFEEQAMSPAVGAPVLLESGALDAGVAERCRAAAALLKMGDRLIAHRQHSGGHDVLQWQATLVDELEAALIATAPAGSVPPRPHRADGRSRVTHRLKPRRALPTRATDEQGQTTA